jgi:GT2 family glycosyltransferase
MREVIDAESEVRGIPITSGCFMFFRRPVLEALGGFDSRYFVYFVDHDLSLRAGTVADVAYLPSVRIVHHGGGVAHKGWWHVALFALGALHFFNTHGWRLW